MSAALIDGKAISKVVLEEVRVSVEACVAKGVTPTLAVVLVGEDPASQIYVRNKGRRAAEVGIATQDHRLPAADTTTESLLALVVELNAAAQVDGILVQLPLPSHIDEDAVLLAIDPAKDVDGFHPDNLGRLMLGKPRFVPCTPAGSLRLIREAGIDPAGKSALVIGRSTIVGKPMAQLLLGAHATVTIAHSRTTDLPQRVADAEIVVAAVGRPGLVKGEWIRPGATVIDVGINRLPSGKLAGDVDFEGACQRAGAITPVPGGVGPMTIAGLMRNVVVAAQQRRG
ncbi:MAG: bifunctional methylenetetrahydrofolate dehydrogenase/methenyltetrahydrofolate cyclohydrolase FolD [Deltaproteobacteria bacterium]|nr:bifunctional methylenetetrahydrofolate dehydrogenase/methenyltetrahydrofolate cyclohydrolase FolD [Deltaproteobacteria bacterium]